MTVLVLLALIPGCHRDTSREITLYTSVDEPIASPIIRDFEKQTGVRVRLVTDTEASKSVGLAERLRAEKDHPQADVWWSNEIFLTINLADEGLLQSCDTEKTRAAGSDVPQQFRDDRHIWHCNGLRARMLVTANGQTPLKKIEQLTDPSLKGKVAIARPTAGTTGGHVAALFQLWGEDRAIAYFRALHANDCKLLGGNSIVAESVGKGTLIGGLTDNDDAASAQTEGGKLTATLPDQDDFGTLAIPTSIALVKGAHDRDAAQQLIEYLVSREVEHKLIEAKFIGWSIRSDAAPFKMIAVDYSATARQMPQAIQRATAILEGRE
jgi:iron(III) transport system substrate-binding protein